MKRTIQFRIWDERLKSFWHNLPGAVRGGIILTSDGTIGMVCDVTIPEEPEKTVNYFHAEALVVEQFTGLKDKTGRDIYEGDIVRFDMDGIAHGPERETNIVEPIWYCDHDACWALGRHTQRVTPSSTNPTAFTAYDYEWWYTFQDRIDRKTIEVIGNVHQNKELLK